MATKKRRAVRFPDRAPIDPNMQIHYGEKPMETWAAVQFGPLANHIDGEVADQYGLVKPDVWCEMVLAALAAKLDAVE